MEVSLLSATTTLLIGAGCFAIGYLFANASAGTATTVAANHRSMISNFFISWARSGIRTVTRAHAANPPSDHDEEEEEEDGEDEEDRQHRRRRKKRLHIVQNPALLEIDSLAEILEDFKMVLVVRNDLKMGKGKIAAQCSHATLGLYKKLLHRAPKALNRWEMCGQVKVVLKCESEEDLLVLQGRAKSLKLPTHITIDAGRTQIAPNSRTVMAILGPADVVDDVTGGLKLL